MIDWKLIDTVFLDMDGTLLDLNFDNHFWQEHVPLRFAEIHARPYHEARAELVERFRSHAGTLNWYCLDFWSRELSIDIAQLKEEVAHLIAVHPDVPAFLDAVRSTGRRVALVTNAHHKSLSLKMARTGLSAHFDELISSHTLGLPKEDAHFWATLATHFPYDPARTLLVDDSYPVLRSARQAGIAHILGVRQPDTRRPVNESDEFPLLHRFADISPH